jgi:hypothetical protein
MARETKIRRSGANVHYVLHVATVRTIAYVPNVSLGHTHARSAPDRDTRRTERASAHERAALSARARSTVGAASRVLRQAQA